MEEMKKSEFVTLNNGVEIPVLGYGVFQVPEEKCTECVKEAIETGYRMIDTASAYRNEKQTGDAVREMIQAGKIKRSDLFLTTKVWLSDYGNGNTVKSVERSLQYLQTDYLDLVLLHQPFGDWKDAWKELERLYEQRKVRTIGVSNFTEEKMKELLSFCHVKPVINQIERHPFYTQNQYCEELLQNHIQPESWGALCEGQMGIFQNSVLNEIGKKYGKSAAQVALRWNLQKGSVVLVRSVVPEHMREDFDVFDFSLTEEEIKKAESLDLGYSEIIDFHNSATERLLLKAKISI